MKSPVCGGGPIQNEPPLVPNSFIHVIWVSVGRGASNISIVVPLAGAIGLPPKLRCQM
jgi:hypothetical protein